MSPYSLRLSALLLLPLYGMIQHSTLLTAQTATDLHEGIRVTPTATAGSFTLSWFGKAGRS